MEQCQDTGRMEKLFDKYVSPTKLRCHDEGRYYFAWLEITNRCPGTCSYCYVTTIDQPQEVSISPEKIRELIDDIRDLGVHHIYWGGGDPLLYPNLFDLLEYSQEQGMSNGVFTTGIPLLDKEMCRRIARASEDRIINVLGVHIDTLNDAVARQLFRHPQDIPRRIEGYKKVLEAGFPPERVFNCLTLTAPSAETFEETFDWCIDTMGARFMEIMVFVPESRGSDNAHLEPSLSHKSGGLTSIAPGVWATRLGPVSALPNVPLSTAAPISV